jgi:hypothetical protein
MDRRPYFHFSGAALEKLVDESNSESELLDIRDELWQRSQRPNNLKLIVRITGILDGLPNQSTSGVAPDVVESAHKKVSTKEAATVNSGFKTAEPVSDCEVLRKTFSARSEILARWGINENLPLDAQQKLFEYWNQVLTENPDSLGRSRGKLASDIEVLAKTP